MTLHKILRETMRLLGDMGCAGVTIARTDEHAYQIRFTPDRSASRGYVVEGRRWIDQTPTIAKPSPTSARGTVGPYVGWAQWSGFIGWNVENVLADDWQFISAKG